MFSFSFPVVNGRVRLCLYIYSYTLAIAKRLLLFLVYLNKATTNKNNKFFYITSFSFGGVWLASKPNEVIYLYIIV